MSEQTFDWVGQHGKTYRYRVYGLDAIFGEEPGDYLIAHEAGLGTFIPIYIGQTPDLIQGSDNLHKNPCIRRSGATHVHVRVNSMGVGNRTAEQDDLIATWAPACND